MDAGPPTEESSSGPTTSKIVFVMWGLGSLTVLILVAFVFSLYATVAARATVAKAEADVRHLSSAIDIYKAHMGVPPARLADLMSPSTNTSAIRTTSGEFSHRGGIIAATRSESRHRLGRLRLRSPFPVRSRGGSGGSCSSPRKHDVLPNLGIQPTAFGRG